MSEDRELGARVVVDAWGDHYVLCDGCHVQAATVAWLHPGRAMPFRYELGVPIDPVCHRCVMLWYSKTRLGSLVVAFALARGEAARPCSG